MFAYFCFLNLIVYMFHILFNYLLIYILYISILGILFLLNYLPYKYLLQFGLIFLANN